MVIRKHIAVFVAFAMVMASMFIGTVPAKAAPGEPSDVVVQTATNLDYWNPSTTITWSGSGSSGYNVYCNGSKLNSSIVYTNKFTDTTTTFVKNNSYTYTIKYVGNESLTASTTINPDVDMMVPDASMSKSDIQIGLGTAPNSVVLKWPKKNDLKVRI